MGLVATVLTAYAAFVDFRTREIPDWVSIALAAWGVISIVLGIGGNSALGFCLGALLGFSATAVLFYLDVIGGGDVKIITALGGVFGPRPLVGILLFTSIFGGFLALIAKIRGKRDFAYGPAIFAAVFLSTVLGYAIHGQW